MQNVYCSAVRCTRHFYHHWVFHGRKACCAFNILVNLKYPAWWDSGPDVYFLIKALLESRFLLTHSCVYGTRHSSGTLVEPRVIFLEPLAQARATGPGCAWPSGRPWAPACWQMPRGGFGTGSAGNDLIWGQEALERTWVADRNFEVWPHQDRDWNTRPGRNLTLSWAAMSPLGEQTRKRSAGLLEVLLYRNIKNFFLWLLFMEFWHPHII